ncbi:OB-fold-containig protein [Sphingobacterium hotanense]|uniref:OB-fold-containig protein n=1 Tax=Sphingobacterium hotanense TaxID=649196 RepID=UPI0021A437EC|nr:OB-fold-containig protein [Sphingobacterium hotanense]MCT1525397.1 DUF1449 family protein [Sphingobacterium hotanense]
MTEIWNILFNPLPNAIMTLLTGMSLVYWLFTMLLGDGFEMGTDADIQFEGADVQDVDMDADTQADMETEQHVEPSFFSKAMDFIYVGKAPMMVLVTLFKFISWIVTIASSLVLNLAAFGWKSVLILIPVFILSFFLLHYVAIPFVKLYKNVGYAGEEAHEFIGRLGKMRSTIQGEQLGAIEVVVNLDVIRLNVKSKDGSLLSYGDDVIVTNQDPNKKFYIVQKDINLNNI